MKILVTVRGITVMDESCLRYTTSSLVYRVYALALCHAFQVQR